MVSWLRSCFTACNCQEANLNLGFGSRGVCREKKTSHCTVPNVCRSICCMLQSLLSSSEHMQIHPLFTTILALFFQMYADTSFAYCNRCSFIPKHMHIHHFYNLIVAIVRRSIICCCNHWLQTWHRLFKASCSAILSHGQRGSSGLLAD